MLLQLIVSSVFTTFVSADSNLQPLANTYLPNNTNIYYSPYAWNVEPTQAATINSAASVVCYIY